MRPADEPGVSPATFPAPPRPAESVGVIRDAMPWAKPARLDGVLERQRFHPLLMAALTFLLGFVLYQIVGTLVTVLAALSTMDGALDAEAVMTAVQENAAALFGGNAVGQFAGFLAFVWFVAWLHSRDTAAYLRVRRVDWTHLALGAAGLFAILPLVSWLGQVNAVLPMPESWRAWDEQQAALIEAVLGADLNLWYVLLVVAVTPAICEEVMFRGYLQRQVERSLGVVASILVVGLLFGAFHLRPTQVLPLATLGIYLGFSVWVTGSLWTGVLIHFLNNGLAAVVSDYTNRNPDSLTLESLAVPWYLALLSALVAAGLAVAMLRRRRALLAVP